MTAHAPIAADTTRAFDGDARARFADAYPETPVTIRHCLGDDPRLDLPALARLAAALPAASIEYNRGDLPIGVDGKPGGTGLSIERTILRIAEAESWAVLKNIEAEPAYAALLHALLEELRPAIEARTGAMLRPQGFVFISSPHAVTPYHFDPEHNLLLQLRGTKAMTQFPAGNPRYAPDTVHESYHAGGARELAMGRYAADGGHRTSANVPGDALHVPVMAPHFVRNGPATIGLAQSITWRSEWSFAEADARGLQPSAAPRRIATRAAPRRWPASNRGKALALSRAEAVCG